MPRKTILKIIVGTILIIIFLFSLPKMFVPTPNGETDTVMAFRTATTYGLMLIIGIWLIRSGIKERKDSWVVISQHTTKDYNIKKENMQTTYKFNDFLNKRYYLIGCTVLVFISLFYWFQYRPTSIRKECAQIAREKNSEKGADGYYGKLYSYLEKQYELDYEDCIRSKGL